MVSLNNVSLRDGVKLTRSTVDQDWPLAFSINHDFKKISNRKKSLKGIN